MLYPVRAYFELCFQVRTRDCFVIWPDRFETPKQAIQKHNQDEWIEAGQSGLAFDSATDDDYGDILYNPEHEDEYETVKIRNGNGYVSGIDGIVSVEDDVYDSESKDYVYSPEEKEPIYFHSPQEEEYNNMEPKRHGQSRVHRPWKELKQRYREHKKPARGYFSGKKNRYFRTGNALSGKRHPRFGYKTKLDVIPKMKDVSLGRARSDKGRKVIRNRLGRQYGLWGGMDEDTVGSGRRRSRWRTQFHGRQDMTKEHAQSRAWDPEDTDGRLHRVKQLNKFNRLGRRRTFATPKRHHNVKVLENSGGTANLQQPRRLQTDHGEEKDQKKQPAFFEERHHTKSDSVEQDGVATVERSKQRSMFKRQKRRQG